MAPRYIYNDSLATPSAPNGDVLLKKSKKQSDQKDKKRQQEDLYGVGAQFNSQRLAWHVTHQPLHRHITC